jgi:hypothetical protein
MFYVLSWSGRGWIVLPMLIVPGLLMVSCDSLGPETSMWVFRVSWIVIGLVCVLLGRIWNAQVPDHKFARLRIETWGYILLVFGLLMAIPAAIGLINSPYRKPGG